MSDIYALPVLSRQAFTLGDVHFLDKNGVAYTPDIVEKRVVTEDGTEITNWTEVGGTSGFADGDDIEVTADETELQDPTVLAERHIVLIVGDRNTDAENPLRVIVQVQNRERLP